MKDTDGVWKRECGHPFACCMKWEGSFVLLNIVSMLLEIQMIKSMNQRTDVCFSNSFPSGDSLEWPLSTVPSAPADLPPFLHSWWSAQQPTPNSSYRKFPVLHVSKQNKSLVVHQ